MDKYITDKHRKFYVNGKLEFALFFDKKITDQKLIINSFLESKDWKWYINFFKVTVTSIDVSKDLMEVYIKVKEK